MTVAVIDIGKTNAKVCVVDTATWREVAVRTVPNVPLESAPYRRFDTAAHWRFVLATLAEFGARHAIEAIVPVTHGAAIVLVDAAGDLALPIIDYEDPGPEATDYAAHRPPFAETGSPPLKRGLNVGAQLYYQLALPGAERTANILTYPQYLAMRLTGTRAVEPTSLGAHTDLWAPRERRFSSLVRAQGWDRLMPPVVAPGDVLGTLLPEVATATGLDPATRVHAGIHDSNASLLPHLVRPAPFTVVSTGTWVIAMAVGAAPVALDPARDTLMNVDARGEPTPSARFMGGREYEILRGGRPFAPTADDMARALAEGAMLLPAVDRENGPFIGRAGGWAVPPGDLGTEAAAVGFYLALVTATSLAQIGAAGPTFVEGPFAASAPFLQMLSAATGRPVYAASGGATGTSVGAAMLAAGGPSEPPAAALVEDGGLPFARYAAAWRARVGEGADPRPAPGDDLRT